MYKEAKECRICGNTNLIPIINLGSYCLTGIFPKSAAEKITSGPLELVKCQDDDNVRYCGLVQLRHSYDNSEMYGDNYGYRSGLNLSMVIHLKEKVKKILSYMKLASGDLVIDIGSNDSTLLQAYSREDLDFVGIDPAGKKFKKYYPSHIRLVADFFSLKSLKKNIGHKKAKIVTSIAMFYDLESPLDFASQVYEILSDDGIWVFEQSYLPAMLEMNAYDTICHEHLEYYCLKQIKWITEKLKFKIVDVEFNQINGGSFSVIVAKETSMHRHNKKLIEHILEGEKRKGLRTVRPYNEFKKRVLDRKSELIEFIQKVKSDNKRIFAYGASTKGNVLLQFCGLGVEDIPFVAEINEDKYGHFTPNTNIPIISEKEARRMSPDYFLVLPWHFRDNIINREKEYLNSGGKLVFPLPYLEIVQK